MSNTKYVIYEDGGVRLFDETQAHNTMNRMDADIISAGFVSLAPKKDGSISVKCYGGSISLRIKPKSHDNDAKKIAKVLGLWDSWEDKPEIFPMR